jgi:hypothetical protein
VFARLGAPNRALDQTLAALLDDRRRAIGLGL